MTIVDQYGKEVDMDAKMKLLVLDNNNKREEIAKLSKSLEHEVAQKIAFANENAILRDAVAKQSKFSGFISVADHNKFCTVYEDNLLAARENLRKERELNTNLLQEIAGYKMDLIGMKSVRDAENILRDTIREKDEEIEVLKSHNRADSLKLLGFIKSAAALQEAAPTLEELGATTLEELGATQITTNNGVHTYVDGKWEKALEIDTLQTPEARQFYASQCYGKDVDDDVLIEENKTTDLIPFVLALGSALGCALAKYFGENDVPAVRVAESLPEAILEAPEAIMAQEVR